MPQRTVSGVPRRKPFKSPATGAIGSPYDLNLFFSEGNEGVAVCDDVIFPVCTPTLARRLQQLSDLNGVPCATDTVWANDWADWLAHAEQKGKTPRQAFQIRGPSFSLYALALDEALAGSAVLVAHACLVQSCLDNGRLVAPFRAQLQRSAPLRAWTRSSALRDSPATRVLEALQTLSIVA